jgi:hypothetical protein
MTRYSKYSQDYSIEDSQLSMIGCWNLVREITSSLNKKKFDVWAKSWDWRTDSFAYKRYCDCTFNAYSDGEGKWSGVPEGWSVTHWRFVPRSPEDENILHGEIAARSGKDKEEYMLKKAKEFINLNNEDGGRTLNNLLKMLGEGPNEADVEQPFSGGDFDRR